jgi:hypothetical protein
MLIAISIQRDITLSGNIQTKAENVTHQHISINFCSLASGQQNTATTVSTNSVYEKQELRP